MPDLSMTGTYVRVRPAPLSQILSTVRRSMGAPGIELGKDPSYRGGPRIKRGSCSAAHARDEAPWDAACEWPDRVPVFDKLRERIVEAEHVGVNVRAPSREIIEHGSGP